MSHYLVQVKFIARPGRQQELASILLQAAELLKQTGNCKVYAVAKDIEEPNAVYVTEVWENKAAHDDSLNNPNVLALIVQAMPLLDGKPAKGQELDIIGGLGI